MTGLGRVGWFLRRIHSLRGSCPEEKVYLLVVAHIAIPEHTFVRVLLPLVRFPWVFASGMCFQSTSLSVQPSSLTAPRGVMSFPGGILSPSGPPGVGPGCCLFTRLESFPAVFFLSSSPFSSVGLVSSSLPRATSTAGCRFRALMVLPFSSCFQCPIFPPSDASRFLLTFP